MKLNNKTYDTLKWVLAVVVPATIALIVTLGRLYHFDTELIIGTIGAFATFIGSIFMKSSINYNKMLDAYDDLEIDYEEGDYYKEHEEFYDTDEEGEV